MRYLILFALPVFMFFSSPCVAVEKFHEIAVEIKISCPTSEELQDFIKSIPAMDDDSPSFAEWKASFVENMTQLIRLVESEKVENSFWSVRMDEPKN